MVSVLLWCERPSGLPDVSPALPQEFPSRAARAQEILRPLRGLQEILRALRALRIAGFQPATSNPIERAVPSMILIAASRLPALRSGSFALAISATCDLVTFPTLVLLGTPEPFSTPA